jgi:hypothetical protein
LTELWACLGMVGFTFVMFAWVGVSLARGVSPRRALYVLRVVVTILLSYLFLPVLEAVVKFMLPWQVSQ